MMNKFTVGDEVMCINTTQTLNKEMVYIITSSYIGRRGIDMVDIRPKGTNQDSTFLFASRFVLRSEEMSDPKKVVINIPDGYVIDKDKSTFEEIVFKEIEIQPVDRFEELDMITGYFVDEDCKIYRSANVKPAKHNRNIFPALKDAESSVALSMLLQLRKEVVGDWKPDYTDDVTLKYQIRRYGNGIDITQATSSYCKIDFPELEMAQRFLKKHEYLIGTYYQL